MSPSGGNTCDFFLIVGKGFAFRSSPGVTMGEKSALKSELIGRIILNYPKALNKYNRRTQQYAMGQPSVIRNRCKRKLDTASISNDNNNKQKRQRL